MAIINLSPFPVLTTERLTLRRLLLSDAGSIFALRSDEQVIKYTGIKKYTSVDEASAWIKRIDASMERGECVAWAITLNCTKEYIGGVCFWNITEDGTGAEIGYDLLPAHQRKGYMREAARAVIVYGFEGMMLDIINADLRTDNVRSVKLLEDFGFKKQSVRQEAEPDGSMAEMSLYTLSKEEYINR